VGRVGAMSSLAQNSEPPRLEQWRPLPGTTDARCIGGSVSRFQGLPTNASLIIPPKKWLTDQDNIECTQWRFSRPGFVLLCSIFGRNWRPCFLRQSFWVFRKVSCYSSYCYPIYLYFLTYYRSLILILSIWKYATSSHVIWSFFIEKYFWKFK
jgi:hypothetical protein